RRFHQKRSLPNRILGIPDVSVRQSKSAPHFDSLHILQFRTYESSLPRPFSEENDLDRLKNNSQIEQYRHIFDVIEIVFQFLACLLDRCSIRILYLRPSRNAGLDRMALRVKVDNFSKLVDKIRPLRTRTDEVHISLQYVYELRYLINASAADEPA